VAALRAACPRLHDRRQYAVELPSLPGNYASSQALGFGHVCNDTARCCRGFKLVGGVRLGRLFGADRQSINSVNTPGNNDRGLLVADRL